MATPAPRRLTTASSPLRRNLVLIHRRPRPRRPVFAFASVSGPTIATVGHCLRLRHRARHPIRHPQGRSLQLSVSQFLTGPRPNFELRCDPIFGTRTDLHFRVARSRSRLTPRTRSRSGWLSCLASRRSSNAGRKPKACPRRPLRLSVSVTGSGFQAPMHASELVPTIEPSIEKVTSSHFPGPDGLHDRRWTARRSRRLATARPLRGCAANDRSWTGCHGPRRNDSKAKRRSRRQTRQRSFRPQDAPSPRSTAGTFCAGRPSQPASQRGLLACVGAADARCCARGGTEVE